MGRAGKREEEEGRERKLRLASPIFSCLSYPMGELFRREEKKG